MNVNKKVFFVMLGFIVLGLLTAGFFWGRNREMGRQMKLIELRAQERTEELNVEITDLIAVNVEKEKKIIEDEKELVLIRAEKKALKEKEKANLLEIARLLEQVASAEPEELVVSAKRILKVDDIWLLDEERKRGVTSANAVGAEFSLAAFRKAVWVFTDWENFTLVREPNYKEKERLAEVEAAKHVGIVVGLKGVITGLNVMAGKETEKYDILQNSFNEYKKYSGKKQTIWKWIGDTALKVGAGYVWGRLSK